MACQTGIRASNSLMKYFGECKKNINRLVKIIIRNEELCINCEFEGTSDWRSDFTNLIPICVDSYEPCFILFRMDDEQWLLISFADDLAPTREKMVLAATTATFKAEFGESSIKYEYHVNNKKDFLLEAFENWLNEKYHVLPMSNIEIELNNALLEQKSVIPSAVSSQTLNGIHFPIDQNVGEELCNLYDRKINYVQLSVDTLNEAIKLEASKLIDSPNVFHEVIPRDKPRYHFYRFSYNIDGEPFEKLLFIYSLPSSGCTIKERMLYSSCKLQFIQTASDAANLKPDRKIEIDSREKMTLEALLEYASPSAGAPVKPFAKPPGPAHRTTNRVMKTQVEA